ncbi:MAG: hypothetical protein V7K98_22810 [Nostoc sp.]|uniref:hypothetical protein n=1 Tax=Nostoc sp. TaxID=1180 RepID=UPI002FF83DA5
MQNYKLKKTQYSCNLFRRSPIIFSSTIAALSLLTFSVQAQNGKMGEISLVGSLKQIDKTQEITSENVRDRQLEKAIFRDNSGYTEVYPQLSSPASYSYNRINLDGDKKPELIVHLVGQFFCGSGGCTTLIYKQSGKNYKLITTIGLNHPPIIISNYKTKGWSDLIIPQFANSLSVNNHGYYVLKFNGKSYPENPEDGVKMTKVSNMTGRALFNKNNKAFELRP